MNIFQVNNLRFSTYTQSRTEKQPCAYSKFGLKMSSPLSADTISFKSTPKNLASHINDIPRSVAIQIHKIAERRQPKVVEFMENLLGDLVVTPYLPENIISDLKFRTKDSGSIVEKASTRAWESKSEILEKMTDLNGCKVVLRDGSRENVNQILDRLLASIKAAKVDLIEIDNKRPAVVEKGLKGKERLKYDYADPDRLEELKRVTDKIHTSEVVEYDNDYTKTNYTALHMLLKLPAQSWVFELQIMGRDVALYKDLDDILYKILNNKNVKKKYKKLCDIIAPLNDPGNAALKEQFNNYRSHVFLFQREKAPHIRRSNTYTERFLPVSNEIENDEMRELLDINNLYQIYLECEKKPQIAKTKKTKNKATSATKD